MGQDTRFWTEAERDRKDREHREIAQRLGTSVDGLIRGVAELVDGKVDALEFPSGLRLYVGRK